ncbi:hypothetical protein ANO14919_053560 [Xylariales sp. No.14919]|nr:hypothetical protein ANO14919_053560 [Xylariales sp. No.14919]
MEYILNEFGEFPLGYEQLVALRNRAVSLQDAMASGSRVSPTEVVQTIDILQELLTIASLGGLGDIVALDTVDDRLLRGLEDVLAALPVETLVLQDELFAYLRVKKMCKPHPEGSAICHFCNWAFERVNQEAHPFLRRYVDGKKPTFLLELDTYPDFPNLEARANDGCDFCGLVRQTLQSLNLPAAKFDGVTAFVWLQFIRRSDSLAGLSVSVTEALQRSLTTYRREFHIESHDDAVVSTLLLVPQRREHALCSENISFMKDSLKFCIDAGPGKGSGMFVPKRLIDLGTRQDSAPTLVSLGERGCIRYATLSYCWGPPEDAAKQLKTTIATLEQHVREIPTKNMPAVVSDTFQVCKILGIRYVWVDALCIVQGADGDWEEQSAQMSQIFGNSYLTICAVASGSCLEGFLGTRQQPVLKLGFASPKQDQGGSALYSLRPGPFEHGNPYYFSLDCQGPFLQDVVQSNWTQRGWVYQEKYLSPRKLYFGKSQMHFQDASKVTSENGEVVEIDKLDGREHREWPKYVAKEDLAQHPHIRDYWYQIVEQVSLLSWTVMEDVLPSISGLADRFQDAISSDYMAGLWADDLHCGLLWAAGNTRIPSSTPAAGKPESLPELLAKLENTPTQVAPSWSWAGRCPGRCAFEISPRINTCCRVRTHLRPEFTCLDPDIQLDGASQLGRLRRASLHLSGRVLGCKIEWIGEQERYCIFKGPNNALAVVKTDWRSGVENTEKLTMLLISSCCGYPAGDFQATETASNKATPPSGEEPLHIKVRHSLRPSYKLTFHDRSSNSNDARLSCAQCRDPTAPRDAWGLLLHPAARPGAYYRVGVFMSRAEYGGSDLFRGAKELRVELV